MKQKLKGKNIRDRILSLFCAVSIVIGLVSGFASGKTYEAKAESFMKQIVTSGGL